MASLAQVEHRNQDATIYVGNLEPSATENLLLELFVQIGKVRSIYMPKDKITNTHNGYAFIEFMDGELTSYIFHRSWTEPVESSPCQALKLTLPYHSSV